MPVERRHAVRSAFATRRRRRSAARRALPRSPRTLSLKAAVRHLPPDAAGRGSLRPSSAIRRSGIASAMHVLAGARTSSPIRSRSKRSASTRSLERPGVAQRARASPLLARALVDEGRASLRRQILLRQELAKGFFGWASYSLIRSERKDHPDATEAPLRLRSDRTSRPCVASYELGLGFEVGARFRYATGFPRTPLLAPFYDGSARLYEPHLRRAELDPHPGVRPGRRARLQALHVRAQSRSRSTSTCRT